MSAPTAPPKLMTTEEFLALPDDGVERWLSRGRLREIRPEDKTMTYRNGMHSFVVTNLAYWLTHWLKQQPSPRGRVHTGDAGFVLRDEPPIIVGIDVAYISAELAARSPLGRSVIHGVPVLAVEVLSPNNTVEEVTEKVSDYLSTGVALVWVVAPFFQTVTVYRPDGPPVMFNNTQELSGESHLPGLTIPVAALFEE